MSDHLVYRVTFLHQGDVYEVYARSVGQGELYGFIEVGELVFGERSQVVVDPSEERIKNEFRGVERFHLPMHAVLRIDEVESAGVSRISASEGGAATVSLFPGAPATLPGDGRNDG